MNATAPLLLGCLALALAATCNTAAAARRGDEGQALAWNRYLADEAAFEPAGAFPFEDCFRAAARRHDVPLSLLLAVARGESDFDPNARSHANAHGLMQILWPDTARHLGLERLSQLYEPCTNVDAGARYLVELLVRYGGDLHLALAAYNYGPQRIPASGRGVPDGAEWYSSYIYRHLGHVLGQRPATDGGRPGRLELAVFGEPYRAAAFVAALSEAAPSLRLDWLRVGTGRFRVSLLYDDDADLATGKAQLAQAGFPVR